jgi:parallel beta-helix repeat protein
MKRAVLGVVAGVAGLCGSVLLAVPSALAAPATLANGFTAGVVAHSGQRISGHIDATGRDVGIYIGPGVHGVTVSHASVTGANDEGILVQDTSGVVIKDSTLTGNAVSNAYNLSERKAIVLLGTSGVVVSGNTISGNGDGGIGVYDDGPNSPSAPIAIVTGKPRPAVGNVVTGNTIADNFNGCGIVVSAKDDHSLVAATLVTRNTVSSNVPGAVGGIIIASGSVGAGTVAGTVLLQNRVSGGYIAGVGMHSSGGGVLTGTQIVGNRFTANGGEETVGGAPVGTGVEILSAGKVSHTTIVANTIANDYYGVFHVGDTATHIGHQTMSGVSVPVAP